MRGKIDLGWRKAMNFWETLRVAWEGISSNKIRSLLTMLGIIIGVAAVIVMMAVSAGTEATIEEQISGLGSNLIIVTNQFGGGRRPGQMGVMPDTLEYEDALAVEEEVSGIVGVAAEQMASAQTVKVGSVNMEVDVLGAMPGFPEVRGVELGDGRFFTQQDLDRNAKVAVLGYQTAIDLFGDPSTVSEATSGQDPIGQAITVGRIKMTVVGVMDEKGLVGDTDYDQRIYVPLTVAFKHFSFSQRFGDRIGVIYVAAESQDRIDSAIVQIESLINRRHKVTEYDDPFINIVTQDEIIETQEATTEAFRNLLTWVAGVSLMVGGIGIMNIMLVSVTERTREIGLRQAVGAAPGDIRLQFLIEALVLSLVGGLIGVAAGVGGSQLFGQTSDMRTVVVIESIVLAFVSAATVGIFFGFYPANKAAQLDPIEALRHE
jgi:putative ABC transport system permease protein